MSANTDPCAPLLARAEALLEDLHLGTVSAWKAANPGNRIEVAVNGRVMTPAFELQATDRGSPADNPPITLTLVQGFNTLRLTTRSENQGFALSAVTIR